MATVKRRKRAYHHGNLREALLGVAATMVERAGAPGVTLRDVARRVGVTHTAAYHHFESREALLREVAMQGFNELGEALAKGTKKATEDPRVALRQTGRAYVEFAVQRPNLFRLMFGPLMNGAQPAAEASRRASFQVLVGAVARAMGAVMPGGAIPELRGPLAAWSVVHGLSVLLIDEQLAGLGFKVENWESAVKLVLET